MEQPITDHYESGLAAMKAGDSDTAVAELEAASRQNPSDYRTFNALGAAYASQGRYEKAIGAFKIAEQVAPGIARIHYNIAQAYEAVGILAEAEYEYEKALTIDPSYTKAKEALMALKSRMHNF
ncbi:MAG: tetratricopeptide repeat protein [Armatimonadetes bacterium]|nr:tetratricopeptide repeat protein [Armatimonadota bacterium]